MEPLHIFLLGAGVIAVGVLLLVTRKQEHTPADTLAQQYEHLTRETLDALPEEELLRAVIANLMAKQHPRNPQPFRDIPLLSPERCAVYTVWLLCNELRVTLEENTFGAEAPASGGLAALRVSPSAPFVSLGAQAFAAVGASRCAMLLTQLLAQEEEQPAEEAFDAEWAQAEEAEQPLTLCRAYIRDHAAAFCDDESDDKGDDEADFEEEDFSEEADGLDEEDD